MPRKAFEKRAIPSVSRLLENEAVRELVRAYSRDRTVNVIRRVLSEIRAQGGSTAEHDIAAAARQRLSALTRAGITPVVNATGVLVHTNLGRSVLGRDVLSAVGGTLAGYCDLEFDTGTGARGRRAAHLERKINALAGSEASLVVNNNAAALMLAINTFARGRDVVVSRGELVEIGGSFRLPEIIERAGGVLREVGTTNKTRLKDYERAAGRNAGLILKIHTSNFRIEGFTEEVDVASLAGLARRRRAPLLHDAGSGLFVDPAAWGFEREPVPGQSLTAGADLVSMSGDKLIGGPQAGIVAGRKRLIDAMKKNPMMRALRPGKITLVALDAALVPFLNPNLIGRVPLFGQLSAGPKKLKARAARLAKSIMKANPALEARVEAAGASIGGGSQPGRRIPSFAVTLSSRDASPQKIAADFRSRPVPVIGAFQQGRFALNVITLLPGQDRVILDAARALGAPS